jgi:septum formation protein
VPFEVRVADVEELSSGADPGAVAVENALRKARAVQRAGVREAIVGCDTIVVLDGVIYGKPADPAAARATLAALAGRTHEVLSGVAVVLSGELIDRSIQERSTVPATIRAQERTALARTAVTFRSLAEDELDALVALGEWRGRSGGYAIQGAAAELAQSIDGELENVVGLPIGPLLQLYPELRERAAGTVPGAP